MKLVHRVHIGCCLGGGLVGPSVYHMAKESSFNHVDAGLIIVGILLVWLFLEQLARDNHK